MGGVEGGGELITRTKKWIAEVQKKEDLGDNSGMF